MSANESDEAAVSPDPREFAVGTNSDSCEEMSIAERDLAEDAQWKRIQQNTFTRWANEHLKTVNKHIMNLETDLSDGLNLIMLIEVLSGKKLPKHNRKPNFRSQKLENVSVALKFLEDEAIRIVNIDSSDITDCKLKLILGLIWTLILHYSISMPIWEGEENLSNGDKGETPKQRLLHWIQSKVPGLPIGNFTTDWSDGKAVGALVDAVAPGLCPDWQNWNPNNSLQNATEAMNLADDWLDVRQLIKPEELVNPNMDELSMMTYLSQYPNAKLKSGAPLRLKTSSTGVKAYGPGIESQALVVGSPTHFTIETTSPQKRSVDVVVIDSRGQQVPVNVTCDEGNNLKYNVTYTPFTEGAHEVSVFFAGTEIQKSPYKVTVKGRTGDSFKCSAFGPGLDPEGNTVNKKLSFDISTRGADRGAPEVIIVDPAGRKDTVMAKVEQVSSNLWRCDYVAHAVGMHLINIYFSGQPISLSPYAVRLSPASDPKNVRVTGRGIQPIGVRIQDLATFRIYTAGAGEGVPQVQIIGPGGVNLPVRIEEIENFVFEVKYTPKKEGRYVIMVTFANQEVPFSPFEVNVGSYKKSNIRAYGPGLSGGAVGHPASFTVETNGETGALGFSIEGPSQAKINCFDNGDGSADVTYLPTAPGEYAVHILCDNEDIPDSPHMADILPSCDCFPDKVECTGPGVEDNGPALGKPTFFKIDTRRAGKAPLDVQITDGTNYMNDVTVKDNGDGTYICSYTPKTRSKHTVQVNYGGIATKNSPFRVNIKEDVDVDKVRIYGPGLESEIKSNVPTYFTVDSKEAGAGELQVLIVNDKNVEIPIKMKEIGNGIRVIEYVPFQPGRYLVTAFYEGIKIPQCPIQIQVVPPLDLSQIKVEGLDKIRATGPGLISGVVKEPASFEIKTRGAGQGGLGVTVEGPCEAAINCRDNGDGTCSVTYFPTEPGYYTVNIIFNDQHIYGSPFHVPIVAGSDLKRIKVSGNGIKYQGVHVDSPQDFIIDPRALNDKSSGRISCEITSPSRKKIENRIAPLTDGTYKVYYTTFEEGLHTLDICYDGIPISGSPFAVNVCKRNACFPEKCKAFGSGLEKGIVNQSNTFTIETKGAGTGGLGLTIEGPSEVKVICKDNRDGSCTVDYVPTEPGDYDVSIKFSDQHIPGSPFSVPVEQEVNPSKVKAYGPGLESNRRRGQDLSTFTVDTREAGKASLGVKINSDQGPLAQKPMIKDNGDGTYTVSYILPPDAGSITARITYDYEDIPNSPFHINILPQNEPEKVKITGLGNEDKKILASIPTEFIIDMGDAGFGDLEVYILGPDGSSKKVKLIDEGSGLVRASYIPDDCGNYKIFVKYRGREISASPFTVQAVATGNAEKCYINEEIQKNLIPRKKYCLTVNTRNAGYGALTCRIRSSLGSDSNVEVEDNGDGTSSIFYTIQDPGDYTMNIKFGGQPVPKGFYAFRVDPENSNQKFEARESYDTNLESVKLTKNQFRLVELNNLAVPSTAGEVIAEIKMPNGKIDKPVIEDNRDGTVSVKYEPREEGLHELQIKFNGEHLQGSPFKFHVDSISSGYVTAYGPGLSHGVCGEPSNFTIYTKGAGAGGLAMSVEGPSKAEISCHDNKDDTVSVSYLPTAPGEYKISVKFGDKHIKGSPYSAKITGEGRKRNQISVGSCSEVSIPGKCSDAELRTLNASIQAPSGLEEPCFLKRLPNGTLGISFTPREVGEHQVSVKRMGKHITNSPFKINVGDKEVGDAKKVKVSGALKEGVTHKDNIFTVDTKNAGYGGLSLSIEGPSKAEISCKDDEDGSLRIAYKPTEPGYYIVNLKFADHHVEGSPFTVKVTGEGSNRVREKIQRQREAVPITEVGSKCKLTFKMPGITAFDLSSTVTSPGGVTEDAEINEIEDGLYAVHFVPKELGVHTVCVKYKEIHIPGSPFQFTVGPLKDGGAHRVHAGGPGLERGEQGQPCEFNVWTREAGAGSLAISVEGPSKAEIDFKDRKDGSCYVSYKVGMPGEYRIGIKFNDQHIPDSPYKVYVSPAMGDAHKLEVAQFPESGVRANHPSSFLVRKNGAKGELDCKIVSPNGVEDDCFIQSIDSDTYSVRFMPRENGIHNIHCKFNGVHIPGSPFRIKVGKEDADPAAVRAMGSGLQQIKTGTKADFIVDTCNAGTGTLAVQIDGPSKVSMDCTEVEEGYKVRYTPLMHGDYYVSIKYNGYHIVGSPFKVSCIGGDLAETGPQETSSVVVETVHKVAKSKGQQGPAMPRFKSDASKVTSKGMGLKKAYLGKQNMFSVHCGDAGNNILYVGVYGPKGPCEEVFIKHLGRNNYQVNYMVKDRGDYLVIVKWGEDHIPGSPFKVDV